MNKNKKALFSLKKLWLFWNVLFICIFGTSVFFLLRTNFQEQTVQTEISLENISKIVQQDLHRYLFRQAIEELGHDSKIIFIKIYKRAKSSPLFLFGSKGWFQTCASKQVFGLQDNTAHVFVELCHRFQIPWLEILLVVVLTIILSALCVLALSRIERNTLYGFLRLLSGKKLLFPKKMNLEMFLTGIEKIRVQLERSEKAQKKTKILEEKMSLAKSLVHDLKPLALALGQVQEATSGGSQNQALLELCLKKCQHLITFFLKEAQEVLFFQDVLEVVQVLFQERKVLFPNRDVCFKVVEKHFMQPIQMSRVFFKTILSQVIENAWEAYSEDQEICIEIKMRTIGNYFLLEVKDYGKGMDLGVLANARQLGFSFGKSQGTGFGLFFCQEVLKTRKGTLCLFSKKGERTRVVFVIPFSSKKPIQLPLKKKSKLIQKSFKKNTPKNAKTLFDAILVENDILVQKTWKHAASQVGYRLRVLTPEQIASQLLWSRIEKEVLLGTPIFIDWNLGTISGQVVAQRFFKKGFHQLILTTGEAFTQVPAPFGACISKSFLEALPFLRRSCEGGGDE